MRYDCKSNNYHLIYRQSFCKIPQNVADVYLQEQIKHHLVSSVCCSSLIYRMLFSCLPSNG